MHMRQRIHVRDAALAGLAVLLLGLPATAAADSRSFAAVADARVVSARPAVAYGTRPGLIVSSRKSARGIRRSFVKFKVRLPAVATVTGTRLWLYATAPHGRRASLSRAGNAWTERGIRWRNQPPARGRTRYRDTVTAAGWHQFRVPPVKAGTYSFLMRGHGARALRFQSREDANAPRLVVTYTGATDPAPESVPTCLVPRPQTTWRAPGSPPLSDAAAAACVTLSGENRPQNVDANARGLTAAELHEFNAARDSAGHTPAEANPNFAYVTGGAPLYGLRSTDDLIEWSAYKWGVPEDLVRAQMAVESGWSMLQRGDRRDWPMPVAHLYPPLAVIDADSVWESLGIAQIRWRHTVPWNPGVEPLRWQSTSFATDYSQALVRFYYDGYCGWCGSGYAAGDADGAYRLYFSGSLTHGQSYADSIRAAARSKPWEPVPPP
jgi:hypothetical protein